MLEMSCTYRRSNVLQRNKHPPAGVRGFSARKSRVRGGGGSSSAPLWPLQSAFFLPEPLPQLWLGHWGINARQEAAHSKPSRPSPAKNTTYSPSFRIQPSSFKLFNRSVRRRTVHCGSTPQARELPKLGQCASQNIFLQVSPNPLCMNV